MKSFTKIIESNNVRGTRLKRVLVAEDDSDDESSEFIAKELHIQNPNSMITSINPIFMEITLNSTLRCENCNTCEDIIVNDNSVVLLFKEALGDLNTITRKSYQDLMSQISQLINGVKYLHSRRIIHGDIKPANCLLFRNNLVKICDYGHSMIILEGFKSKFDRKMYTPNYRPPEVWNGNEWGFAADIWALGCTIFYLIYGSHLFPEQATQNCYISCLKSWETHSDNLIGNSVRLPITWVNPDFFALNSLILKACNPNEAERPSIFDIEAEFIRGKVSTEMILSSSPDSVCRYDMIEKCPHVANCVFDFTCYISPATVDLQRLLVGKSLEYTSLIFMLYFYISNKFDFERDTYIICDIIACSMTGKNQSSFGISTAQYDKLKQVLVSKKFDLFKWKQYFDLY